MYLRHSRSYCLIGSLFNFLFKSWWSRTILFRIVLTVFYIPVIPFLYIEINIVDFLLFFSYICHWPFFEEEGDHFVLRFSHQDQPILFVWQTVNLSPAPNAHLFSGLFDQKKTLLLERWLVGLRQNFHVYYFKIADKFTRSLCWALRNWFVTYTQILKQLAIITSTSHRISTTV